MSKSILLSTLLSLVILFDGASQETQQLCSYEQFIRRNVLSEQVVNTFLNDEITWAKFDSELGYVLNNFMPHDGINSSSTISTTQSNGARRSFMYSDMPCRINTYGNSFTQGHQVSDGETWQEYLAAHIGEPIRNFGVGGYGVYQAYRRMIREESSSHGAEYVMFYIWGDDHLRSLLRSRYLLFVDWAKEQDQKEGMAKMFHGNFWANMEMDLDKGVFVEHNSHISKADDMYKMSDPQWMVNNLKDDLALEMALYIQGHIECPSINRMKKLCKALMCSIDIEDKINLKKNVSDLLNQYSYAATKYILDKSNDFALSQGKKLMVILFDPYGATVSLLNSEKRDDQQIVDYLNENGFNYFDMNVVQADDYKNFNLSVQKYWERYFIGHYNPSGNHFFAYSFAPKVVRWLNPQPVTYQKEDQKINGFKGYLKMDTIY